jgi:Domain of unknown function (DUF222)
MSSQPRSPSASLPSASVLSASPPAPPFASPADALASVTAGLAFLAATDAAGLPVGLLAGCLRDLSRAESAHVAARSRLLSAFTAQSGSEADGHPTTKSWLRWQTRVTSGSAAGDMAWMRRLALHRHVAAALAAGAVSPSYAREVCGWTDHLPPDVRDDADQILLAALAGGADLADARGLFREMLERTAPPDGDDSGPAGGDGFEDRRLRLDLHWRGAGYLTGDLSPECSAALIAVLESLGKKAGPEDDRTQEQRNHDALEEACRRLIASGCLPEVAGQPVLVQLHATLDQLRDLTAGITPPPPAPDQFPPGGPAAGGPRAGAPRVDGSRAGGPRPDGAPADRAGADGPRAGRAAADRPDADRPDADGSARDGGAPGTTAADASATDGAATDGAATDGQAAADGTSAPAGGAGTVPAGGQDREWAATGAYLAGRAAGDGQPGWLPSPAAAEAYCCDAKISTVISGYIDPGAVAAAVRAFLDRHADPRYRNLATGLPSGCQVGFRPNGPPSWPAPPIPYSPPGTAPPPGPPQPPGTARPPRAVAPACTPALDSTGLPGQDPSGQRLPGPDQGIASPGPLHAAVTRYALDMLSGPAGLAARLRSQLPGILGAVSLPLDIGEPTAAVPPHLRRAVALRDRHCAFPGCAQQPSACQVHHLIPRARGGVTALHNLAMLCSFHHLIAIHRWGWHLALNADGTTTATSPDGRRVFHSHSPPAVMAA